MMKPGEIIVYGAEVICPSCVGMPSSFDTYEWLQAAIGRKYPNHSLNFHYVDIFHTESETEEKQEFAKRVIDEDLFYPVVVIKGKIIAEGNPRLKDVYREIEESEGV